MPLAILPAITWRKPLSCERVKVNWEHPLNRELKAYWLLNEGQGNAIELVSGTQSLVSGATRVNTNMGQALSLDGNSDYVNASQRSVTLAKSGTLFMMARFRAGTAYAGLIMSRSAATDGFIFNNNGASLELGLVWDAAWYAYSMSPKMYAVVNEWRLYVLTVTQTVAMIFAVSTAGTYTSGSLTQLTLGFPAVLDNIYLGVDSYDVVNRCINTDINYAGIYNRVLSIPEMCSLASYPYGTPNNPRLI